MRKISLLYEKDLNTKNCRYLEMLQFDLFLTGDPRTVYYNNRSFVQVYGFSFCT